MCNSSSATSFQERVCLVSALLQLVRAPIGLNPDRVEKSLKSYIAKCLYIKKLLKIGTKPANISEKLLYIALAAMKHYLDLIYQLIILIYVILTILFITALFWTYICIFFSHCNFKKSPFVLTKFSMSIKHFDLNTTPSPFSMLL